MSRCVCVCLHVLEKAAGRGPEIRLLLKLYHYGKKELVLVGLSIINKLVPWIQVVGTCLHMCML